MRCNSAFARCARIFGTICAFVRKATRFLVKAAPTLHSGANRHRLEEHLRQYLIETTLNKKLSPSIPDARGNGRTDDFAFRLRCLSRTAEAYARALESKNNILLVTHELARTGAPRALLHMAQTIRREFGASPVILSPSDGPMRPAFEQAGAFVLVHPTVFRQTDSFFQSFASSCSAVIVNGIGSTGFLLHNASSCKRLHWWLHETTRSFDAYIRPYWGKDLAGLAGIPFSVWCGSPQSLSLARVFGRRGELLLYGIPEEEGEAAPALPKPRGEPTFLLAGTVQPRKGQDIFVKAVGLLPEAARKKARFRIIGDHEPTELSYAQSVAEAAAKFPEITLLPNMPLQELLAHYREADIPVSASLDDPMPIVITYGLMFGMPCIVSDAIGHALLPEAKDAVDVVPAGNAEALSAAMRAFIENPGRMEDYRDRARRVFEQYFSMRGFAARLGELLGAGAPARP
jgi:glycosyltransferase involved in cell wall biosynthesis